MYKLNEMLGELYTNVIPYMNYISFQDKVSRVCGACRSTISADYYKDKVDEKAFLEFLGLTHLNQPSGCEECNFRGIDTKGIQVLSEHLYFNSEIKERLLRADIHEQAVILREYNKAAGDMESVMKAKLLSGDILLDQAMNKLDTWR
jgi:type II secretory ATPase GspE/PulE/Tfp pilus assembly ATPase PilB-like protein